MDEIARADADLRRREPTTGSTNWARMQWPCNEKAPEGTPVMHIGGFVRGKGNFILTEYVADRRAHRAAFPLILTTGASSAQYNVGAQTRRTENRLARRRSAGNSSARRGTARDQGWRLGAPGQPRRRNDPARRDYRAGAAGRGLHHVPPPGDGANVITTEYSDWATNCPEYKVTAVQVSPSNGPTEWQENYDEQTRPRRIAPVEPPSKIPFDLYPRSSGQTNRVAERPAMRAGERAIPEETAVALTYNRVAQR